MNELQAASENPEWKLEEELKKHWPSAVVCTRSFPLSGALDSSALDVGSRAGEFPWGKRYLIQANRRIFAFPDSSHSFSYWGTYFAMFGFVTDDPDDGNRGPLCGQCLQRPVVARMVGMDPAAKLASAGDGHRIFKWIHSLPDGPCGLSVQ